MTLPFFLLILFSVFSYGNGADNYFYVGDLAQYTTNGVPAPSLSGSIIHATTVGDPADNGILLFLSPDMEASLKSAMDGNCEEVDSGCYQAVMDVLEDVDNVLTTRSLEERQLGLLAAGGAVIAGLLYPLFYEKETQYIPEPLVTPPAQLEDSFDMETATAIVVVTEGSPGISVRAPPEQDKATGPPAVITTLASAAYGGGAGDVEIQLQEDVADHIQLLLSASDNNNCDVGDDFFNSNTIYTRDLDLSSVACGAQNILAAGIDRDGFPNWLLMNSARFPWTQAEVVTAVNSVIRWALNSGTRLNAAITPGELQGLAVGAFALSATKCPPQTAIQCGAECGVHSWAPQFDCTTTCSTVTGCNAQSTITMTATSTFPAGSGSTSLPSGGKGQQIAVASYINPLADPAAWNRLIAYDSDKMPILVANVVNGPDSAVDLDWKDVITRGAASGKTVLGYVRTGYLGYTLYGGNIGGIFFDEGWPECGANNEYVDLYKYINNYTKRKYSGAFTVLNPGSPIASCYEDSMDTLLTFELSYDAYKNSYTPNDWTPKDPRKLWHIIYNVPESAVVEVAKLAKDRGVSFIEITSDIMPNPYDILPAESYTSRQRWDAIDGGSLLNKDTSSWPSAGSAGAVSGLSVLDSDYSSAKVSWNSASSALGYNLYHIHRRYPDPGWSVNFKIDEYVCTHYMVEGTTLYKYSGTLLEGSTAPPWSWTSMGSITLEITDYTYKWTLPIGTSIVDTSKFVIQAQGYNPLINVFQPDPGAYDCKGSSMCTTPGLLASCDHAVNYLHRDDDPFYTAGAGSLSGNCWGDQTRGCGVFIQGDSSSMISGNDMWNAYQDIRNIGGCSKCGSFHRDDGCLVTINYVYQCDNHAAKMGSYADFPAS
ncbi:Spherulation-specific family 4-domain-containing protein [Aspergillus californicus]